MMKHARENSDRTLPPRVSGGLPLVGHLLEFRRDHIGLFRRGYREHGALFRLDLGPWPVVIFAGVEMHRVFYGQTDKALRTAEAYGYLREMLGSVGLTQDPEGYAAERHILHAPFRGKLMRSYIRIMDEEIQAWIDGLGDSGRFELVGAVQQVTQSIAAHALMGRAFRDEMSDDFWALYRDLAGGLDPILPPWLPLPRFIRRDRAKRRIRPMIQRVVEARRSGRVHHDDMLQQLAEAELADGTRLPVERVVSYVLALVFAGFETTTGHICWALVHLTQHPDELERVRAQIDETLATHGQRPLDPDALKSMTWVYHAARETERILPVADRMVRNVAEEMTVGGYTIPKGWVAMASGSVSHRIDDVFLAPERYDPGRFERGEGKDPYSLIGFGGGKHKCPGMKFTYHEIAVWLARLLHAYEISLEPANPPIRATDGVLLPVPVQVEYRRRTRPRGAARPDAAGDASASAGGAGR